MQLTNKYNLPSAIFNAIKNDDYSRGDSDYTCTELIQPPKITVLKQRHREELSEDISDVLYRLYGKLIHKIIEEANENELVETRYYGTYLGKKISAQIDSLCLYQGVLSDFKFTSWFPFKFGSEPKQEWILQLNTQLDLLRKSGLDANEIQIVGLIRDWKESEAKRISGYPQIQIAAMKIPIMAPKQIQLWIRNRIREIEEAKESLPNCSKEDNWDGKRCERYCIINKYCDQYNEGR
jgi:hypothetical protein